MSLVVVFEAFQSVWSRGAGQGGAEGRTRARRGSRANPATSGHRVYALLAPVCPAPAAAGLVGRILPGEFHGGGRCISLPGLL